MTTTTTPVPSRPLYLAYREAEKARTLAQAARAAAQSAYDAATPDAADAAEARLCEAVDDEDVADAARDRAWRLWVDSDEEREYLVSDGNGEWTVSARPSRLLAALRAHGADGFEPEDATWWLRLSARNEESDEKHEVKLTIDPKEPACRRDNAAAAGAEHVWARSFKGLAGLGSVGNGGGTITTEACLWCGCRMVTDSWATDMSDGTQGHTRITYAPGHYVGELRAAGRAAAQRLDLDEEEACLCEKGPIYRDAFVETLRDRPEVHEVFVDDMDVVTWTFPADEEG